MARSCKRCERPLLATDTACWHCGLPVEGAVAQANEVALVAEQSQQLLWLGLAIGAVLALLLATLSLLSAQPNLFISPRTNFGPTWLFVSDAQNQLAISLPRSWQAQPQPPDSIEGSLTAVFPDANWHLIYAPATADAFVLVGESDALHRETAVFILDQLALFGEQTNATEQTSLNNVPSLTVQTSTDQLVCQWHIIRAQTDFLLLGCNTLPAPLQRQQLVGDILNSFQLLD